MKFTHESQFTKWFCTCLQTQGAYVLILSGNSIYQQAGLPDRYVSHKDWQGFIEFKIKGVPVSTAQKLVAQRLEVTGTRAIVVRWHIQQIITFDFADGENLRVLDVRDFVAKGVNTDGFWGKVLLIILKTLNETDEDASIAIGKLWSGETPN